MYWASEGCKTNVSQGARPMPLKPDKELENLALKAARAVGCAVDGVDILEGPKGYLVSEVNSRPGFRGIQMTRADIAGEIVDYILSKVCRRQQSA